MNNDSVNPALLNAFAEVVAHRFAETATGLDPESRRFVRVRPSERTLCGFLTPAGGDQEEDDDVFADTKYEQSHIGFEWAVPREALGSGLSLRFELSFAVYARVLPSYPEICDNSHFSRDGQSAVVEVWKRFPLAGWGLPRVELQLELDRLAADGVALISAAAETATCWDTANHAERDLWPGRAQLTLRREDIADEAAYHHWTAQAQHAGERTPSLWRPAVDCRLFPSPSEPDVVRLMARFVNLGPRMTRRDEALVDTRLYSAELCAVAPGAAHADSECRALPHSYRYDRSMRAVGINCQPRVGLVGGDVEIVGVTVPVTHSPRIVPREVAGGIPKFATLADPEAGPRVLNAILADMEAYDARAWAPKLQELTDPQELAEATAARNAFLAELGAFRDGVAFLARERDGAASVAFRLMNEAMKRAGLGRRRPITNWHLFQIVFIVSQLPLLAAAAAGGAPPNPPVRVLWFPAGGGKTEAFLGLIVWHAFFDRLRGKQFGTTAVMRYPLRLLTYQQLQRVSWVLGQAEEVRLESGIRGAPFSLGYYVGESTTPNSIGNETHAKLVSAGVDVRWQRVFRCPSCGQRTVRLRYNTELRLVEHYCDAPNCRTARNRLPVYIVDDDLYRYVPTAIVATVDKLAQLGQNRRFSQLLGRIELYCSAHGAAFRGSNRYLCEASREAGAGRQVETCGAAPVHRAPFVSLCPSLHVQDEMHLLRESLATFDSHYETAALALQRSIGAGAEWALIGATATIEGYVEQAQHLYLKGVTRFPAPGPEAFESFYYTEDRELRGRFYIGVLGVGRSHTPAVSRAIAIMYGVIERARQLAHSALPAAQAYLGLPGASAMQIEQLAFLYEIILTYVLTRKGGDQVGEAIDTRVRRDVEALAGGELRMETFNSSVDMPRMIATMEEIESADPGSPIGERVRGVVATNIISHGVDIDRFNVIVFAGLPRQFAEYIQASARVGRQVPGISLLVVTPQADRDRSVYDRFDKFHQYVDRLIEPVPINRWSEAALELTVRGLVAAYVMGVAPARIGSEVYLVRHVQELFGRHGAEALNEASVVEWIVEAVGASSPHAPRQYIEAARNLGSRYYGMLTGASQDHAGEPINQFLNCMRSLRDIDDPAFIRVTDAADAAALDVLSL